METTDMSASAPYKFRGSDFFVTMECKGGSSLMVEIEDRLTADQWRATFDASYIEDLTHKTGNFKQFNVFVSMLESAITQSSTSVCLDLLTYSDLETLRQKKNRGTEVKSSIPASRSGSTTLMSKRYLIVTYSVEFDRIHYPLPLPYVGKPDPRTLQDTIRQLRAEIKKLKQSGYTEYRPRDFEKLQKDFKSLLKEKEEIEEDYLQFRREMKNTATGSAAKEIRTLKAVVRNLEQELMREKTDHQRASSKRSHEYRELLEEVEELRASERNLRVRVKSLTNELALYKRGRQPSRAMSRDRLSSHDRSNRSNSQRSGSGTQQRSFSRERSAVYSRQLRDRSLSQDRLSAQKRRDRSSSRERPSSAPNHSRRSDSPASLRGSLNSLPRSPSPAGRRFDPTSYIKEQNRRKKEAALKKKRRERSNVSGLSNGSRRSPSSLNSSRHSAYLRTRSRTSSFGSQGDLSDGGMSDGSYTSRLRNFNHNNKTKESPQAASQETGRKPSGPGNKVLASTPDSEFGKHRSVINKENEGPGSGDETSELYDRSSEISEIDERLNRLQQLMKATLP